MRESGLPALFAIYRNTSDYPGRYVVREWKGVTSTQYAPEVFPVAVERTLEGARWWVPAGKVNIGRMPEDDPCIVEVWV